MRAPQASILAMLELQQDPQTVLTQAEFLARIEKASRSTTITCSLLYVPEMVNAHVLDVISDQGYGIARADQSRLLKRFQRFNVNEQPKNDGSGLGLVFVKTVIDRHHGQIEFVSAHKEGTNFQIKLPAFNV